MFHPEESEIKEFIDNSINYWLEKVRDKEDKELPEYATLKEQFGKEILERFERHYVTVGVCCGVGMIVGFLHKLEKENEANAGNDGKD